MKGVIGYVAFGTALVPSAVAFLPLHRAPVSRQTQHGTSGLRARDAVFPNIVKDEFHPQYFEQTTTHFPNVVPEIDDHMTFQQRWWYDAKFYKPGGPVILLDAGEMEGERSLYAFREGILGLLAEATGGMSVVLEHRFYGKSMPFDDLTTSSLLYLDVAQSLADSANFVQNVVFPGFESVNMTALYTPYIYYGGGYAGAKAAFMRIQYPDLIYGAIGSSATVHSQFNYWEYYDLIRRNADPACMDYLIKFVSLIDFLINKKIPPVTTALKQFMFLPTVTDDRDFVNALVLPLDSWQAMDWNPKYNDITFPTFCTTVTSPDSSLSLPPIEPLRAAMQTSGIDFPKDFPVDNFRRYAYYFSKRIPSDCSQAKQDSCYKIGDPSAQNLTTIDQTWRSWLWQLCTQLGGFSAAPPTNDTPSIVSRLIDTQYSATTCTAAFGDAVPAVPKIDDINKYGSFAIAAPRLAFIDGDCDPWRHLTPHSSYAQPRQSTMSQPFVLIARGNHVWDSDSLGTAGLAQEPAAIKSIHQTEIAFVRSWLADFSRTNNGGPATLR